MLTFEQKQQIIESYSELERKDISLKRVNYHLPTSLYEKTLVVEKLHPNGNGYVFVGDLLAYESMADERHLVNIREFSEKQLRDILADVIAYLTEEDEPVLPLHETWSNREGDVLTVRFDGHDYGVYHGENVEEIFGKYETAKSYLLEEGFRLKTKHA
ncbi:hypothetical protein [Caryophanon tenue]|uniref:Uncharacterized protein n=1 Tax=Caryophanon tenue TaxID=33978 RepID=A0A1C0YBH0_9BACL|nr:hypothetical protein [Caryophanon tenue]OCS84536.1 hypothetical protein A6M13_15290 [Caryophanon tenue]